MKNTLNWALKPLALFALVCLATYSPAQKKKKVFIFGVYTTDNPTTMYKKFSPVTKALSERVTVTLGQTAEVKLRVFMSYDAALTALVKGNVDMARFGPASYVLAKARNPKIELLAMESKRGKKTFFGMIVVRKDSPIKTMEDLRGKRFAFGNRNSTVGRFFAQQELLAAGISAQQLSKHAFLDRHDKVFRAVQRRLYDAGSIKNGTFKKMNKKQQLRVLKQFVVPSKPWVLRSGMPVEESTALRTALLSLKDKDALKSLKVAGFLNTSDKEYEVVRASMLTALKFEHTSKPGK